MAATNPFVIRVPVDEQIIDIDANTRRIKLGNDFGKTVFLNVAKDHMAETIWFRIDRYFDIQDLAENGIRIFVQWYVDDSIKGFSESRFRDITSESGKIIFEWPIDNSITAQPGTVYFSIVFFKKKNDREYEYMLNTLPAQMTISKGLDIDENILTAEPIDYMNNYLKSLIDSTKSIGSGVADTIAFLSGIKNEKEAYITGDKIYALAYNDTQNNIESTNIIYDWVRTDNGTAYPISEAQKYDYMKLTGENSIFTDTTYNGKLSYYEANGTDYNNVSGILDAASFEEKKDNLYLKVAYCEITEKGTYTVSAYGKTANDKSQIINNNELSVIVTGLPSDLSFNYSPAPDSNDESGAYYYGEKTIQLKPNIDAGIEFAYSWYKDSTLIENNTNTLVLTSDEGVYKPKVIAVKNRDSKEFNSIYPFTHCLDISNININASCAIDGTNYVITVGNTANELGSIGEFIVDFYDDTSKNVYSISQAITNNTIIVPIANTNNAIAYTVTVKKGAIKAKSTNKASLR